MASSRGMRSSTGVLLDGDLRDLADMSPSTGPRGPHFNLALFRPCTLRALSPRLRGVYPLDLNGAPIRTSRVPGLCKPRGDGRLEGAHPPTPRESATAW